MKTTNQKNGRKGRISKYDISFRRQVARAHLEGSDNLAEVAKKHGVTSDRVGASVKQFSSEITVEKPDARLITVRSQGKKE